MGIYSISDLEELTGVKTHTLRIWEKRYGLLRPQRTESNVRIYEDSDLQTLRLIQKLNNSGVRISRIAEMTTEEMQAECSRLTVSHDIHEKALLAALEQFDVTSMNTTLDTSIRESGFQITLLNLIIPFLHRMEVLWLNGAINQSHEACFHELVKRKTIREIDLMPHNCSGPKVIMFLPKGNHQELQHLFLHYFLRQQGLCVTDIGCEKNMDCVCEALRQRLFECIIVVNEDAAHWQFADFMQTLASRTDVPIIISGRASEKEWSKPERIIVLDSADETISFVSRLHENLLHHLS